MSFQRVLIANRGEIAIRIQRAAAELGIETVAVHSADDTQARHVALADHTVALDGRGPAAYLDMEQLVAAARAHRCEAIHPGYGFLAESPAFAARCADAGIRFVGPSAAVLARLGDKVEARNVAAAAGVPVLSGSEGAVDRAGALAFFERLGGDAAMVIKAVAGGGGRGMRVVRTRSEIDSAFARCESEAHAAFGDGRLYVEEYFVGARHVEIQILGDSTGAIGHLWERECSLQRRHQKLIERAPAPGLSDTVRERIAAAAVTIARATGYTGIGTFEFLIGTGEAPRFVFIEANPRLQVEHTVTEMVTNVDLVATQFALAAGRSLAQLGLATPPRLHGAALQARVNMERMLPDGTVKPTGGMLAVFEMPSGPGVRTDTYGYTGYTTNPAFDSLLAKVIVHDASGDPAAVVRKARRALAECRIEGVATNIPFLRALLAHDAVASARYDTTFIERHLDALCRTADGETDSTARPARAALAGTKVSNADPLAVLALGKSTTIEARAATESPVPEGDVAVRAPLQGTLVAVHVAAGDIVHAGAEVAVMEAMKMEHVVTAPVSGRVRAVDVVPGDTVFEGARLLTLVPETVAGTLAGGEAAVDLDRIRPDLAEVIERHAIGSDARRPDAVARRHKKGQRTARENVADLVDPGTFVEYGALQIAAQRRRRSVEDLIEKTPADGMVAGVGRINGEIFPEHASQCVVMSYDYTVLAGTQGHMNHLKKDRMFELAENNRLPVVLFAEGGGGRPGDTDGTSVAGLDCYAFNYFARLSGLVPLIGITAGYCFAGNAALLGCCDVVIATEGSNIGMGGPAMIEGGGLGVFRPDEVGPLSVQVPNGVVDLVAKDEREAVDFARRYLSYFQGSVPTWQAEDQRLLRHVIPENRVRIYDIRRVIDGLADTGSVLELRRGFGHGMVTAFARIEGRPLGIVANNPAHLGGAIDADAADKATRFMQLCDAFDLPLLFLCDTPGFMVGPEAEKTAQVRRFARMFVNGANLSVPFFTMVLRKGYGLGAQAMAGGGFKIPMFTIAWPTGEFGGMGLEGAVKLGYRNELAAIDDPEQRRKTYEQMVERMYRVGKGVNVASTFEIDDVIDPADSRKWILTAMRSAPPAARRHGKKRPCVDTW
jgi:acetyl/propionyl-CoA carboxylase alpha subunit/acetyl-CoA carboxylase carboxyltransferase component